MLYEPHSHLAKSSALSFPLEDGDIVMTGTPSGVGPVEQDSLFDARLLHADTELVSASWRAI
jgi:2-keto-4-pentenoate hydratase/2-oxohepta-3-ene-1,7-dioic acid hydratase in catechol pathway